MVHTSLPALRLPDLTAFSSFLPYLTFRQHFFHETVSSFVTTVFWFSSCLQTIQSLISVNVSLISYLNVELFKGFVPAPFSSYYILIHCYGSEYINMPMMSKWASPKTSTSFIFDSAIWMFTGISKLTSQTKWLILHQYFPSIQLLTSKTWELSLAPHSFNNRVGFITNSVLSSNSSQISPFLSHLEYFWKSLVTNWSSYFHFCLPSIHSPYNSSIGSSL